LGLLLLAARVRLFQKTWFFGEALSIPVYF